MGVRLVRISKASKPNKAQWTFKKQPGTDGWVWLQTNGEGVMLQQSRRPLATLDAAKIDAASRGWTPAAAGLSYKVE